MTSDFHFPVIRLVGKKKSKKKETRREKLINKTYDKEQKKN